MSSLEPTLEPMQFRIETEIPEGTPKKVSILGRTDHVVAAVQVIRNGGENNLHSHSHLDGVWTVLAGRARFYGAGDEPMADLGPYEGILIPRGCKYWFESSDPNQTLIIHQVEASDIAMVTIQDLINDRVNHAATKPLLATTLVAPDGQA